jgi:hypothetical protein
MQNENTMSITSKALKIGTILLLNTGVSQLFSNPAQAGCFSDDCSNKREAEASRNRTLHYGGSYNQAGDAYLNRRYGSGAAQYYIPNYRRGSATTNRAGDCQRLLQQIQLTANQGAKNIAIYVYRQQCTR